MNRRCSTCGAEYTSPNRGWYDKYLLPVCSPMCLYVFSLTFPVSETDKHDCEVFSYASTVFRSGYESSLANIMRRHFIHYVYELHKFYTLPTGYVPDFLINSRLRIEVKGQWSTNAKVKFKDYIERYSNKYPIYVVDGELLARLKRR